jgi:hypothetical protein
MKLLRLSVFLLGAFFVSNGYAQERIMLQNYDQSSIPNNKGGNQYPYWSDGRGGEGGVFTGSIDSSDAVSGSSFKAILVSQAGTGNAFYAQFNPYDGVGREFARTYAACGYPSACGNPSQWKFNTYNRMRFWIKQPSSGENFRTNGQANGNVGTYVKCVAKPGCPDYKSDEAEGGHWYHNLNIPSVGTWVQVILNTHPDHVRGATGGQEHPNQLHPTGEPNYNYFDTLTRFYIQMHDPPSQLPATYRLDEIEFFQEPYPENDAQIRNIAATYLPSSNRVILTWFRNKNENSVNHEVRYAFSNIHAMGWNAAAPAPNGIRVPPGWQGYNGMHYDTTAIPTGGQSTLYLAIKPHNSNLFSQVAIPLNGGSNPPPSISQPPVAPSALIVK